MAPRLIRYWLCWSLLTLIVVKMIQGPSLTSWASWLFHRPIATLLNLGIILSIFLIFQAILANRRAAAIAGFCTMVTFATVHTLKKQYLQDNLYPWDFLILPEMLTLLPSLKGELFIVATIAFLFIFSLFVYLIFSFFKQKNQDWMKRLALLSCSVLFLCVITSVIQIPPVEKYLTSMVHPYDRLRDYERNGLLLSFAIATQNLLHNEVPKDYSKENVNKILNNPAPIFPEKIPVVRPNVIMIMSEAFFDPTKLPIIYSKDPLQHLHALHAQHGASSLVAPAHGGNTCNTEFEVLTGLSMNFFPQGSLPYQQHIRKNLPALPRIFKEYGYQTIAIHPNQRNFFSRETIYKYLGFDDYISIEDWDTPEIVGVHISDKDVMRKILEKAQHADQPYFIFAVTLQNHQPFTTPHDPELKVLSENLSQKSRESLNGYLAGVQDADKSLLALIEQLKKSSVPTILVYFGDHLPALPSVYAETEYLNHNGNPFVRYTVPALIWSNYKEIPAVTSMSTFYLGGYVLEQAGINPPVHFEFLRRMFEHYPVISYAKTQDKHGALFQTEDLKYSNDVERNNIQDYWILQYDLLYGEP